jgi:tRNA nucleotidyltransferase (CCA-adding enzyme)
MSVGARFDRFLSSIEPTSTQKTNAASTHRGVRDFLEGKYAGSTSFLIGYYKKDTLVRPPTDIDIMFVLPYTDYLRVERWSGNKQSQLL